MVYLVGEMPDEDFLALTSAIAVRDPAPVILLDTPGTVAANKGFLAAYRPDRVIPVGTFRDTSEERERRLGVTLAASPSKDDLFRQAERVVVCPAKPRSQLLQSACLAGAVRRR